MTKQERDQYMFNLDYGADINDLTRSGYIIYSEPESFIQSKTSKLVKEYYENQQSYFENRKHELAKLRFNRYSYPHIESFSEKGEINNYKLKKQFIEGLTEEAGHKQPLYLEEDLVPSDIFSNPEYLKN